MSAIETMKAIAEVGEIFKSATVLERNNLLQGRSVASVVCEYMATHPEINDALNQGQSND